MRLLTGGLGARLRGAMAAVPGKVRAAKVKTQLKLLDLRDGIRHAKSSLKAKAGRTVARVGARLGFTEGEPELDRVMFHFINGRNNLESFAVKDMEEMVKGSEGDPTTIHVVEVATLKDRTAKRYVITNGKKQSLGPVENVDFGSVDSAHAFFDWGLNATDSSGRRLFRAKQYDFNLWDHGGATGGDMFDDTTGHHISLAAYGRSFPSPSNAGVHVADMCLAGNIEHVTELFAGTRTGAPAAKVFVASEETEPGAGHDYQGAGKALSGSPKPSLRDQGKAWVSSYIASYSGGSQGSSQVQSAALDVTAVQEFLPRMRVFSKELIAAANGGEKDMLRTQAQAAQKFAFITQRDLYDFADLVAKNTKRESLKVAADAIKSYVTEKAVLHNELSKGNTKHARAHGLAIYLPTTQSLAAEKRLFQAFAQGVAPPEYQGYRITMASQLAWQTWQRALDRYEDTAFAKAVPEWVDFTKIMTKR